MCFDLGGFLSSGCSSNTTNNIRVEQTNEQITKLLQRHSNQVINSQQLIQDMSVSIRGTIECPPGTSLDFSQTISGDFQFITTIDDVTIDELKELLNTKIKESAKQTVDQYQGFLSQKFNGDITNNITNILKNVVDTEITIEKLNQIKNSLVSEQHMKVDIDAVLKTCPKFSQDMLLKIMARNIITNISQVAMQNQLVSDFMSEMDNHVTQRSEGLGNVIQNVVNSVMDFFKGLGWMGTLIVLAVIIGGVMVIKAFFGAGGSTDPEELASAGRTLIGKKSQEEK